MSENNNKKYIVVKIDFGEYYTSHRETEIEITDEQIAEFTPVIESIKAINGEVNGRLCDTLVKTVKGFDEFYEFIAPVGRGNLDIYVAKFRSIEIVGSKLTLFEHCYYLN